MIPMSQRELQNAQVAYYAASQGMVLLKNDHQLLPIAQQGKVALFGQGAVRTVRGGTGSGDPFNGGLSGGGDIHVDQSPRYHIHILDAFLQAGYEVVTADLLREYARGYDEEKEKQQLNPMGTFMHPEQELDRQTVQRAAMQCDTAIYVLSRNSGEGTDRSMIKSEHIGDYKLSDREKLNLQHMRREFSKLIVVLNVGGIIDISEVQVAGADSILLMSQAGQEGGRALVDVLNGTVTPSGKLTDTWASQYQDYPAADSFALNDGNADLEKYEEGIYVGYRYFDSFDITPAYPFGFGLSYTRFDIEYVDAVCKKAVITVKFVVENIGDLPGAEVVQLYFSAPESELEMPYQELAAFKKTRVLEPGEVQELEISVPVVKLASFDESRSAYILSQGEYIFRLGNSSRHTNPVFRLEVAETVITEQVRVELPLEEPLKDISHKAFVSKRTDCPADLPVLRVTAVEIPTRDVRSPFYDESVTSYVTEPGYIPKMSYEKVEIIPVQAIKLSDVLSGHFSLEAFVAQMTDEELAALNCGTGWGVSDQNHPIVGGNSESVPGAAGETTKKLTEKYGIPSMILADGPGGIRIAQEYQAEDVKTGEQVECHRYCTAWPVGTLLAQSFDEAVMAQVGASIGMEMAEIGIELLLGPGMNIHRDPLCGRNFEYYSEDPRLTGIMAAAFVKGLQSLPGIGACIKHFAANNQETNRYAVDTWINQRALREIYLKGFEIAVREAQPMSIMTAYNLINRIPAADSFDLCTDIPHGEWGFKGLIMTDWNGGCSTPSKSMHAGNDLIMPGGAITGDEYC